MWKAKVDRATLGLAAMLLLVSACQGAGGGTGATGANGGGGAHPGSGGAGGGTTTSGSGSVGGGGSLFPDAAPPEGTFPCGGDHFCKLGVEHCQTHVDGPCCGSSSVCAPLPQACAAGADCTCFTNDDCLTHETLSSCEQTAEGGFTITCLGQ